MAGEGVGNEGVRWPEVGLVGEELWRKFSHGGERGEGSRAHGGSISGIGDEGEARSRPNRRRRISVAGGGIRWRWRHYGGSGARGG